MMTRGGEGWILSWDSSGGVEAPHLRPGVLAAQFDGSDFEAGAGPGGGDSEVDETAFDRQLYFDFLPVGGRGPVEGDGVFRDEVGLRPGAPGQQALAAFFGADTQRGDDGAGKVEGTVGEERAGVRRGFRIRRDGEDSVPDREGTVATEPALNGARR